ncbi:MAG: YbhB/YbcL family Raf kinase inhibitor-like protein [Nostocaceae cyanobacterium]|nr:YbhB/YbcL family Raf kinase inhibitor-like protein [Nostocaceae cyanobacterium]
MITKRVFFTKSFAILIVLALSVFGCNSAGNRDHSITSTVDSQSTRVLNTMKLESSVFAANGLIPGKYTCDDVDTSPPLSWDEPPPETASFALIVDDPDAPRNTFVHWVLYDLPATVRQLPENIQPTKTLPNGGVHGKNDFGKLGYGGPCPPSGTHRYFFKLYALDKKLTLQAGATKKQILAAMEGHILATAELMGKYQRQR